MIEKENNENKKRDITAKELQEMLQTQNHINARLHESFVKNAVRNENRADAKLARFRKIWRNFKIGFVAILAIAIIIPAGLFAFKTFFVKHGYPFTLEGTATNFANSGGTIYLGILNSENPSDTLRVYQAWIDTKGKFKFAGNVYYPSRAYLSTTVKGLYYTSTDQTAVFYLEPNKDMTCTVDLENPYESIKIADSQTDNDFRNYLNKFKNYFDSRNKIIQAIGSAQLKGDTKKVAQLQDSLNVWKVIYNTALFEFTSSLKETSAIRIDLYSDVLRDNQNPESAERVRKYFHEMPFQVRESMAGRRLEQLIDDVGHYRRTAYDIIPNLECTNIKGEKVDIYSLFDGSDIVFYFYSASKYQYRDIEKELQAINSIYKSQNGKLKVVTISIGHPSSGEDWKNDIVKAGNDDWINLNATYAYDWNLKDKDLPVVSFVDKSKFEMHRWNDFSARDKAELSRYLYWSGIINK